VAQDCADLVLTKCTLIVDADFTEFVDQVCMEPPGSAAVGEACTRPTNTPGIDTCLDSYCANFGSEDPADRTCHEICQDSASCEDGAGCVGLFDGLFGACSTECNPFPVDTCAAGSCGAATQPNLTWGFYCFPSQGSTPDGDVCATFDECLDGSGCLAGPSEVDNHCRPYCDTLNPCDIGFECSLFEADTPGAEDVGICFPAL
jgi:hypothetical protein